MKKKILVIGGSGLVGSTVIKKIEDDFEITATHHTQNPENKKIKYVKINLIKEHESIQKLIKSFKPEITLHTFAHSSVDLCENDHSIADSLHVDATRAIKDSCEEINSKLIFLSTDAVFDGELQRKYSEEDKPNPINYYGKTKLKAEKIVLSVPNNVVLRTAVIYGAHERSRFTKWVIDTLSKNKMMDPHVDQYNTPTFVEDLAVAILKIINLDVSGLFHATGKTCINRYDFAKMIAGIFNFEQNLIKPVTSLEKKQDAPRPKMTCLNSSKLEKCINYNFCELEEGLKILFKKTKYEKNTFKP